MLLRGWLTDEEIEEPDTHRTYTRFQPPQTCLPTPSVNVRKNNLTKIGITSHFTVYQWVDAAPERETGIYSSVWAWRKGYKGRGGRVPQISVRLTLMECNSSYVTGARMRPHRECRALESPIISTDISLMAFLDSAGGG
jgi:hypothetical protein